MKNILKGYTLTEQEKRLQGIRRLAGIFAPFLLILLAKLFCP